MVDTNNQTNYLTYNLFAYDKLFCLNASTEGKDSNNNKEYQSLNKCLDHQDKGELFTIADIIQDQQPFKKMKTQDLKPISFVKFNTRTGKPKPVTIKALFDSGGSGSLISEQWVKNLKSKTKKKKGITWKTPGGDLNTSKVVRAEFTLPELHEKKLIQWDLHIAPDLGVYDMIIGRDLLTFLGVDILFSKSKIEWEHAELPFKDVNISRTEAYHIQDSKLITTSTERIKKILDTKYEPANLKNIVQTQKHLTITEQEKLYKLLNKYDKLFDGSLGVWKGTKVNLDLKKMPNLTMLRLFPYFGFTWIP